MATGPQWLSLINWRSFPQWSFWRGWSRRKDTSASKRINKNFCNFHTTSTTYSEFLDSAFRVDFWLGLLFLIIVSYLLRFFCHVWSVNYLGFGLRSVSLFVSICPSILHFSFLYPFLPNQFQRYRYNVMLFAWILMALITLQVRAVHCWKFVWRLLALCFFAVVGPIKNERRKWLACTATLRSIPMAEASAVPPPQNKLG